MLLQLLVFQLLLDDRPTCAIAFNTLVITQSIAHDKPSSNLQLTCRKSRGFQKLLRFLGGTSTSVSSVALSFGV